MPFIMDTLISKLKNRSCFSFAATPFFKGFAIFYDLSIALYTNCPARVIKFQLPVKPGFGNKFKAMKAVPRCSAA
jgi:hypothetical protein